MMLEFLIERFGDALEGQIDIGHFDGKNGGLTEFRRFDLDDFEAAVEHAAKVNAVEGQSVYVRAALIKPEAPRKVADEHFLAAPGPWVDCDDEKSVAAVKELEAGEKPTAITITGRTPHKRIQAFWKTEDPIADPDELRALNSALAQRLGSDPSVVNPSRLMRLPGSIAWARKPGRVDEMTKRLTFRPERRKIYDIDELRKIAKVHAKMNGAATNGAATTGASGDTYTNYTNGLGLDAHEGIDPIDLLKRAAQGVEWHDSVLKAVAHYVGVGRRDDEIVLLCMSARDAEHTEAETERDVRTMIKGARAKWNQPEPAIQASGNSGQPVEAITATPLRLIDPRALPQRQWIVDQRLVRGFVTTTIAPGGVGKSTYSMQEAIAVATGRRLTALNVEELGRAWIINEEDPLEELERRVAAICLHWSIDPATLTDKVFLNSGVDRRLIIAKHDGKGTAVATPDVDGLIEEIEKHDIAVVVIDPFVRSHRVNENSNDEIDFVAGQFSKIAQKTGCAINLIHHTRKQSPGFKSDPRDQDSGRGASALNYAARIANNLSVMTKDDAGELFLQEEERRFFVRIDDAKLNMGPPAERAQWFKRTGVDLGNRGDFATDIGQGDQVGVLVPWTQPEAGKVSVEDARKVLTEVGHRWEAWHADKSAEPFSSASNSDRSLTKYLRTTYRMKTSDAVSLVKSWLETGKIGQDEYNSTTKKLGLFLKENV
jgi:hypothetical protein